MGGESSDKASSDQLRENFERIIPTLKGVKLLPVTKTQPIETLKITAEIMQSMGLPVIFGENYAQELLKKAQNLSEARFHFIGTLQSNKIKELLKSGIFIQTLGSMKHIELTKKIMSELGLTGDAFLQVNVSEDPKKSGVSYDEAKEILSKEFFPLKISGLMTILEDAKDHSITRGYYRKLASLGEGKLELSMGMSNDYQIAIDEGATMVRLGSVLFGQR
jgi:pyridoxal phosphate enzyme (YggS family)